MRRKGVPGPKRKYVVGYLLWEFDKEREIEVMASNKVEAYDVAVYKDIPSKEGEHPYSAWVKKVYFLHTEPWNIIGTMSGKPY